MLKITSWAHDVTGVFDCFFPQLQAFYFVLFYTLQTPIVILFFKTQSQDKIWASGNT